MYTAFSIFNFIKALIPKFSQHNTKNDFFFNVHFHNMKLALKIPKLATKMLKWETKTLKMSKMMLNICCQKSGVLNTKTIFGHLHANNKQGVLSFYEIDPCG